MRYYSRILIPALGKYLTQQGYLTAMLSPLLQLEGLLAMPTLDISQFIEGVETFDLTFLREVDELKIVDTSSHYRQRLGKQAERILTESLKRSERYRIVASGLNIYDAANRSVGEIDYILRDAVSQELVHVELACKFYTVRQQDAASHSGWLGPNGRDALEKKIAKMQSHQLPLLYRKETEGLLTQMDLDAREIKQAICFKVCLFYHLDTELPGYSNAFIEDEVQVHRWLYLSEWNKAFDPQTEFYLPHKREWITLAQHHKDWFPAADMLRLVKELHGRGHNPMIWSRDASGETARWFVLADVHS